MFRFKVFVAGMALALSGVSAYAAPAAVQSYAAQCDKEIGVTVPDFNCDDGTVVPTSINGVAIEAGNGEGFTLPAACDRPNVLAVGPVCDPGSKFLVISNSPDAFVVAHCRRQGHAAGNFGDVAIIQHNKVTGATCFYQNHNFHQANRGGFVRAPINQLDTDPQVMDASGASCMNCHDNGPLIRSPYLAQIKTGKDVIPGSGDFAFNTASKPYFMVGSEGNKTYSVKVTNTDTTNGENSNTCTTCHALSVWSPGSGVSRNSATHLAIKSTQEMQLGKTPSGEQAPMWMSSTGPFNYGLNNTPLNNTTYSAADFAKANEIATCANQFTTPAASFTAPLAGNPARKCTVTVKPGRVLKGMSLVSPYAKCIDVNFDDYWANSTNGRVRSWDCYGPNLNQKWTYDPVTLQLYVTNGATRRCLSVEQNVFDGMAVNTTTCDSSTTISGNRQKWNYSEALGLLTNVWVDSVTGPTAKKCLDIIGAGAEAQTNGTRIDMWSCTTTNATNQAWAFQDINWIRIASVDNPASSINLETGVLTVSPIQSHWWSAQWEIERFQGGWAGNPDYRIRNKWTNQYLNMETGSLQLTAIKPYWWSARWHIKNIPTLGQNAYYIQNLWQPDKYLLFVNGTLQVNTISSSTNLSAARWSFSTVQ